MSRPLAIDQLANDARNQLMRAAALEDPKLALEACLNVRRVLEEAPEYVLLTFLPFQEAAGKEDEPAGIEMRAPCKACGHRNGVLRCRSGQDTVRCAACDVFQYNAPRSQTGRPADASKPVELDSKFAGSCRECGARYAVGDRVVWQRGLPGALCLSCGAGK